MAVLTIGRLGVWAPRPRRAALPWLLLAAALHLLLMTALWRLREPVAVIAPPPVVTYLRLLWSPTLHATRRTLIPPPPTRRAMRPPRLESSPHVDRRTAAAITPAAPPATGPDAAATVTRPEAPLDLRLPERAASAPPTLGSQVLNDVRVIRRPGFGERFAATLGTDNTLREDKLANGTLRLRRGTRCIVVSEAATTRLDPFSQTYAPTPRPVGRCP